MILWGLDGYVSDSFARGCGIEFWLGQKIKWFAVKEYVEEYSC